MVKVPPMFMMPEAVSEVEFAQVIRTHFVQVCV